MAEVFSWRDAPPGDYGVIGDPIAHSKSPAMHHAVYRALGLDLTQVAGALGDLTPPVGRGERMSVSVPGGTALVIDESYNANPASVRAALTTLGAVAPAPGGRRIAVLADMLELGEGAEAAHRSLADAVADAGIDLVFAAGPLMRALWSALPAENRGAYAADAQTLEHLVVAAIHAGDVIMIKGSNSTRISRVVAALKAGLGSAPAGSVPAIERRG